MYFKTESDIINFFQVKLRPFRITRLASDHLGLGTKNKNKNKFQGPHTPLALVQMNWTNQDAAASVCQQILLPMTLLRMTKCSGTHLAPWTIKMRGLCLVFTWFLKVGLSSTVPPTHAHQWCWFFPIQALARLRCFWKAFWWGLWTWWLTDHRQLQFSWLMRCFPLLGGPDPPEAPARCHAWMLLDPYLGFRPRSL